MDVCCGSTWQKSARKSCKIDGCPKKYPTVLHTQPWERPKEDTVVGSGIGVADGTSQVHNGMACINNASCSHTGAGFSQTGMAILPVKVRRGGSEKAITMYAFLDNGSSSTFCAEALMRQLDINGPKTKISLTTLEKKDSLVDSFLVHDLEVTDLDENYIVKLPILYTREEIPVSKDDIPTQEDVDRWPHLGSVYLPTVNAKIGLLIACNVPEALDPLEAKNSQHGGPYATRTHLGWAVNGPLKRNRRGLRATSFFPKADTELCQMVEDFYNRDFGESIADSKTEPSQAERRFMKRVEESLTLKDGHYEISLQRFKVPNSKQPYSG